MEGWDDPDRRDAALERIILRAAEPNPLSRHELAAVFLASHGVEQEQAAKMLCLSLHTIKSHSRKAMAKLGARSHAHTVATALRIGLID